MGVVKMEGVGMSQWVGLKQSKWVWSNYNTVYSLWFSFLDDAFRKNLESALRFGNPLLVQAS